MLAAAAEIRRGAHGIAERPIEARRILGRIRQNAWLVEARLIERGSQRADATVHHVRRREYVDAGLGVAKRLAGQGDDCRIVGHVAALVDQAVLAVAGVRVERDVGHNPQRRKAVLQSADGARYQALCIPGRFRIQRFVRGVDDRK